MGGGGGGGGGGGVAEHTIQDPTEGIPYSGVNPMCIHTGFPP